MEKSLDESLFKECEHECDVRKTTCNTVAANVYHSDSRSNEDFLKMVEAIQRSKEYFELGKEFRRLEDEFLKLNDKVCAAVNKMNKLNMGE